MNLPTLLSVCLLLSTSFTVGAAVETRSDIDPAKFPSSWDVTKRTTYQVDVMKSAFAELETSSFSLVVKSFDLDSYLPGFLLFLR